MHQNADTEERVVEYVERLGVVEASREGTFGEEEEDDECYYYIFPPEEDKEVRKTIVKPSPMVQDQSIQILKLPEAEITDNCS